MKSRSLKNRILEICYVTRILHHNYSRTNAGLYVQPMNLPGMVYFSPAYGTLFLKLQCSLDASGAEHVSDTINS